MRLMPAIAHRPYAVTVASSPRAMRDWGQPAEFWTAPLAPSSPIPPTAAHDEPCRYDEAPAGAHALFTILVLALIVAGAVALVS